VNGGDANYVVEKLVPLVESLHNDCGCFSNIQQIVITSLTYCKECNQYCWPRVDWLIQQSCFKNLIELIPEKLFSVIEQDRKHLIDMIIHSYVTFNRPYSYHQFLLKLFDRKSFIFINKLTTLKVDTLENRINAIIQLVDYNCPTIDHKLPEVTAFPTISPSVNPTGSPSTNPTKSPSKFPSQNPTQSPSQNPTQIPTTNPTKSPSTNPTSSPS
jgi:hypothetical protein